MGTYIPRPGSVAAHACAWFKQNPTRMLTLAQICGRWGGTAQTVTAQLGAAEDAEFLLSERIGKSDVYKAGPKLNNWTPWTDSLAEAYWEPDAAPAPAMGAWPQQPQAATPQAAVAPAAAAANRRRRLPALDVASLQVKTGELLAPVRGGPGAKGQSRYTPLLEKLTAPNSWIEVPRAYMPTLNKAIQKYRKDRPERVIRCVAVSDETCHLQRLADKKAGGN